MDRAEQGDFTGSQGLADNSQEMARLASRFATLTQNLEAARQQVRQREPYPDSTGELLAAQAEAMRQLQTSLTDQASATEAAERRIAELTSQLAANRAHLTRVTERQQALYQVGLAVNTGANLPELLDLICQKATAVLQGQIGYILILDEAKGCLRIGGSAGLPADFDRTAAIPFAAGGVSFRVIVGNRPVLVDHIDEFPEFAHVSQFGYSRKSLVCTPISGRQQAIGSLTVANPHDGSRYGSDDLELLVAMAAHASVAIRHAGSSAMQPPA
jgi:hypothetical protein